MFLYYNRRVMKYSVKILQGGNGISYLSHRGRSSWCMKTALKHKREWLAVNGGRAELEENNY